jgi:flavin-dependent dehydrogenase
MIFGGAFPAKDCRKRFEEQKEKLLKFGFEFGAPQRTEACLVLRPENNCRTGYGNVFLIGEAAGFISPSSLEGISWAIRSASILAYILNSGTKNADKKYRRKTFALRIKLLLKNIKSFFIYAPFLRNLIMKSGLSAIKIISEKDLNQ